MAATKELILLTDREWGAIDAEPCRVLRFTAFGCVREGRICADRSTPYAVLILECKKVPQKIRGYITHKVDFRHLWYVFEERTVGENEEVVIFWTKRYYKVKWLRHFRTFPKLRIDVHHRGYLEFLTDPKSWHPQAGQPQSIEEMLTPIVRLQWDGMYQGVTRSGLKTITRSAAAA